VQIHVSVRVLPHGEGLELPAYATPGAAGCDLRAAVATTLLIAPGGRTLVPTGLAVAIPDGYEGQVRMRSGLALKKGLILPNAPGTIDSDYRGELCVLVANIGAEPVEISRGDRIAQLVFAPVARGSLERVETLPETSRAEGGFGSTGGS
jgi:dUTP pyrophosphatase